MEPWKIPLTNCNLLRVLISITNDVITILCMCCKSLQSGKNVFFANRGQPLNLTEEKLLIEHLEVQVFEGMQDASSPFYNPELCAIIAEANGQKQRKAT